MYDLADNPLPKAGEVWEYEDKVNGRVQMTITRVDPTDDSYGTAQSALYKINGVDKDPSTSGVDTAWRWRDRVWKRLSPPTLLCAECDEQVNDCDYLCPRCRTKEART